MNRIKKRIAAALTAAALAAGLAIPAGALDPSAGPIRVSSCKGNTLEAGERSLLIIGPAGAEYTASSGNPEAVAIERVMTYWVAVAKAEGTAEITVTGRAGDTGSLTLTVGTPKTDSVPASAPTSSPTANEDAGLTANMELRQETIRLINEIRRENGAAELEVNESLMNAAQDCSAQMFTDHDSAYECGAAKRYGYPYGFGDNLTWFTGASRLENAAETAVGNWKNSPFHFQTMIDPASDTIGVGITIRDGKACCYMFAGVPDSYSAYG